ncbi:hypothetical protein Calab_0129 [Caldithrix abyssi DSM 13497]|uniref:Uncharacterized protein n=1 Tax=Caldithrix abyssi DSM 13497 TaxID=880073 RepID=H1XXV9_CALAY|nr:hypothetical protein Calab_0129 [Caldithrix abyssi DSM 13497]
MVSLSFQIYFCKGGEFLPLLEKGKVCNSLNGLRSVLTDSNLWVKGAQSMEVPSQSTVASTSLSNRNPPPRKIRSLSGVEGSGAEGEQSRWKFLHNQRLLRLRSATVIPHRRKNRSLSGAEGSVVEGSGINSEITNTKRYLFT